MSEGMGLDQDRNNRSNRVHEDKPQTGGMGLESKGRTNQSKKQPQASSTEDIVSGGKQTAEGATQASRGVARIKTGDIKGGAKDVVEGADKLKDGAEKLNDGLAEKGIDLTGDDESGLGKLKEDEPKTPKNDKTGEEDLRGKQLEDPYNPDNYESLFDDVDTPDDSIFGDEDDGDDSDDSLLSDDDDSDNNSDSIYDEDDESLDDSLYAEGDESVEPKKKKKSALEKADRAHRTSQAIGAGVRAYNFAIFLERLKLLMVKALQMVKSALYAFASTVMTGAHMLAGYIASVTGLSTFISVAMSVSIMVVSGVTLLGSIVTGVANSELLKKDDPLVCDPNNMMVSDATLEWEAQGDLSAEKTETIRKAWSVFDGLGISDEVAAGIIGNFALESNIDPTTIETIYTEPYSVGPLTASAYNAKLDVHTVAPDYIYRRGNTFTNSSGKTITGNVRWLGVGIAQWSNGRAHTFMDYMEDNGLDWFDVGSQLVFMFDGDNPADRDLVWDIAENSEGFAEATERFVREWERPAASAMKLQERIDSAGGILVEIRSMEVDTEYADSILSDINVSGATSNHHRSEYYQDDGCGEDVATHYQGAEDGTGVFPDSVSGRIWKPKDLPKELEKFIIDPALMGLSYQSSDGWTTGIIPGECVAFTDSFFKLAYGLDQPLGNGGELARNWYNRYKDQHGGELNRIPKKGAMFSYMNSGVHGHTGIVNHVFANGDILIAETNWPEYSGKNGNDTYTWNYRFIQKEAYETDDGSTRDWEFYKPDMKASWEDLIK